MTHILKVTHNAGLFSCFSQRLSAIISYANKNQIFPQHIDSSEQFSMYKPSPEIDVSNILIKSIDSSIQYREHLHFTDQFTDYAKLNFSALNPIISKYFSISDTVKERLNYLIQAYDIDFFDTCSIFYRGNDKRLECELATKETFIEKASIIKKHNKNIKFLVQTDDSSFLEAFQNQFQDSISFRELHTIADGSMSVSASLPQHQRLHHAIDLLAAVNVVSRCKYLVTHSGNCGFWACLYRGSSEGIIQHFTSESSQDYHGWLK